ncbi:UvrD-helicase domain-containing protein [Corynebacterium riegelii]|uniref:UvrD-helicase domain-containing protein n=1 Tax=Corynebacterium riegelii TaxID=156976 RepID=UPI0015E11814|nr:UvrD-helicase domain-containing protein [Corynebacterium riegelii]
MSTQYTYLSPADIVVEGDAMATDLNGRNFIQWSTDSNVFVQAGAGSGKTTTLIQRLLTLIIDDGINVDQIAAITFTEAAAGKLVSDLRQALTQVAATGTHAPFAKSAPTVFRKVDQQEAQARADRALESLPGAAIGTLHSFCLRLLKQFPLEAGLPPKVDKVDELRQQVDLSLRSDAIVEMLTRLIEADDTALAELEEIKRTYGLGHTDAAQVAADVQLLVTEGASLEGLADVACWMDQRWGELGETLKAPRFEVEGDAEHVRRMFDAVDGTYDEVKNFVPENDELLAALTTYRDAIQPYVADAAAAKLWQPILPKAGGLSAKDWEKLAIPDATAEYLSDVDKNVKGDKAGTHVKGMLVHMHNAFEKRGRPGLTEALTGVLPVLAALVLQQKDSRLRKGTLEYHDMVFLADELVCGEDNGNIRTALHEQFKVIFVDEFQDTDPVQYDIVRAIASGEVNGTPVPGRLFVVGDPKQSIYRFRNADIDSFDRVKASYGLDGSGHGVLLNLYQNFRSSTAVVSAINQVFPHILDGTRGEGLPTQASYEAMEAQPTQSYNLPDGDTRDLPGKVIFLHEEDTAAGKAAEIKQAEEEDIVALIRAATSNVGGEYYRHNPEFETDAEGNLIEGTATPKALQFSDIAVLTPTNGESRRIVRALSNANIPSVSEGSTLLFRVPEVSDLLTVLRAISDPADAFAQVAALRTALLGCSDAQLAAAAKADAGAAGFEQAQEKVQQERAWLRAKALEAQALDVGTLVRHVVSECELRNAYVASQRTDNLGSLEQVIALADKFGRVTGLGLREFVRWADEQTNNANSAHDPVLDNNANGVRVMTIHRSKGLEFPMVIAAGFSNPPPPNKTNKGFSRGEAKVAEVQLGGVSTPGYERWKKFDTAASADELKRLAYVALTRAESVLAVPLHIGLTKANKRKAVRGTPLIQALDAIAPLIQLQDRASLNAPGEPLPPLGLRASVSEQALSNANPDRRQALLHAAAALTQRLGVTSIAHAADSASATEQDISRAQAHDEAPYATRMTGSAVRMQLEHEGVIPTDVFRAVNANVRRGDSGAAFGSAVHEVMERLPDSDGDVNRLSAIAAALYGLPDTAIAQVAATARAFSASKPYMRALDSDVVYRELPIAGHVTGVKFDRPNPSDSQETVTKEETIAVNGYIDLLYRDGATWVIADYKTDEYATPERVASYFLQLELYARILSRTLGTEVGRLELIFQDGDECQVVDFSR